MTDRDASGKFVAGNKANPGGKIKRTDLTITALIDSVVTDDDWKFIIETLLKRARRGDNKAIEMLLDRRFGKAMQPTDNKHTGELNLVIDWGGTNASNPES
jgi:hypothetical protein